MLLSGNSLRYSVAEKKQPKVALCPVSDIDGRVLVTGTEISAMWARQFASEFDHNVNELSSSQAESLLHERNLSYPVGFFDFQKLALYSSGLPVTTDEGTDYLAARLATVKKASRLVTILFLTNSTLPRERGRANSISVIIIQGTQPKTANVMAGRSHVGRGSQVNAPAFAAQFPSPAMC